MITKMVYQKYLLVLFYYPPEWVLRQYNYEHVKFLYFWCFLNAFYIKSSKCHEGRLIYIVVKLSW